MYHDTMMNFAQVVTRKIDGRLETEHSRQSEFKTVNDRVQAFMENKSKWYTKGSTSNWHIAHMRYEKWAEHKSRYCIAHFLARRS